jgi:hypothetical protein
MLYLSFLVMLFAFVFDVSVQAQQKPPKPITVTVAKMYNLDFGSFCAGNGIGTNVIVDAYGNRTKTGNIILLGSFSSAALFIITAIPGTFISILDLGDTILTGPGGATLTLRMGDSYPPSPFIATGDYTPVSIGGRLMVPSAQATPGGVYNGDLNVIFIQE